MRILPWPSAHSMCICVTLNVQCYDTTQFKFEKNYKYQNHNQSRTCVDLTATNLFGATWAASPINRLALGVCPLHGPFAGKMGGMCSSDIECTTLAVFCSICYVLFVCCFLCLCRPTLRCLCYLFKSCAQTSPQQAVAMQRCFLNDIVPAVVGPFAAKTLLNLMRPPAAPAEAVLFIE